MENDSFAGMTHAESRKDSDAGDSGPSPCWPLVVSFGGGTNSAAMLIEMARRGVRPDLILFADTGGELPETYQFVRDFSDWLSERGMPSVVWCRYEKETLEANCLRQNMLPSLAYGFKGCSHKYKIQPQNKWVNNWKPAKDAWASGGEVVKLIGYDAGEHHRAKIPADEKYLYAYPLCGFRPAKSACFFCPAAKKWEVLSLAKTHPDLMTRALEMERNAKCEVVKGLGRNWRWEDLVKADEAQMKLFDELPDPVPCGCYDGGVNDGANVQAHLSRSRLTSLKLG
jgi:hypothetical protein